MVSSFFPFFSASRRKILLGGENKVEKSHLISFFLPLFSFPLYAYLFFPVVFIDFTLIFFHSSFLSVNFHCFTSYSIPIYFQLVILFPFSFIFPSSLHLLQIYFLKLFFFYFYFLLVEFSIFPSNFLAFLLYFLLPSIFTLHLLRLSFPFLILR